MPLTLIQGHYRIVHAAPDGDSIKFYTNNPGLWQGPGVRTNHAGGAQLRLDGIDALETHYQPKGGSLGMLLSWSLLHVYEGLMRRHPRALIVMTTSRIGTSASEYWLGKGVKNEGGSLSNLA